MKFSNMHRYRLILTILVFLLSPPLAMSQTPIANRVKAKAERMKNGDRIVAKYTDDRRHCLYFVRSNRLFRYDALTGATSEVVFSIHGYNKIINTWLSRNGNVVFVLVDRSALTSRQVHVHRLGCPMCHGPRGLFLHHASRGSEASFKYDQRIHCRGPMVLR